MDDTPRGKRYSSETIDVYFDPRTCIHAAECVRGLPAVFVPTARPWITTANATAGELVSVIERCPTGALHYVRKDGGTEERPDGTTSIRTIARGPLYVRGEVELRNFDGTLVRRDTRVALCRCGASKNKPFCDNSHRVVDFEG